METECNPYLRDQLTQIRLKLLIKVRPNLHHERGQDDIHILPVLMKAGIFFGHVKHAILLEQLLGEAAVKMLLHNCVGHSPERRRANDTISDADTPVAAREEQETGAGDLLGVFERPRVADELAGVLVDVLEDVEVLVRLKEDCGALTLLFLLE